MNKTGQQMRLSDTDLSIIKNTFADNEELIKVLRKIFLPELSADVPLGQNIDLWMTLKVDDLEPEQAIINLKARNTVIQHLEMCLMQLNVLAGSKEETVEATKERLKKDSSK